MSHKIEWNILSVARWMDLKITIVSDLSQKHRVALLYVKSKIWQTWASLQNWNGLRHGEQTYGCRGCLGALAIILNLFVILEGVYQKGNGQFQLVLFVPWITGRFVPLQLKLPTSWPLSCFLVVVGQQGPLWAVKRKDQVCLETVLAFPFPLPYHFPS